MSKFTTWLKDILMVMSNSRSRLWDALTAISLDQPRLTAILVTISNYSIILSVSYDKDFSGRTQIGDEALRYSLIKFPLGKNILHLATLKQGSFKLIHTILFDKACPRITPNNTLEAAKKYKERISKLKNRQVKIEESYLKRKHEENISTLSKFNDRVNIYTAALVGTLPFTLHNTKWIITNSNISVICAIVFYLSITSMIYVLHGSILSFHFTKMHSFAKSTFKDLKDDPNLKNLANAMYIDWHSLNYSRDYFATLTIGIQESLICTIVTTFCSYTLIIILELK